MCVCVWKDNRNVRLAASGALDDHLPVHRLRLNLMVLLAGIIVTRTAYSSVGLVALSATHILELSG